MMEQGFAQQAQQQKTQIQQAPQLGSQQDPTQTQQQFQHQHKPRDVGSMTEEAQMAVKDVADALVNLPTDMIKNTLGLKRDPKDPEEMAKLRQFHQGWTQLDAQQQAVAQQRLQSEAQRKEMMTQEDEAKKEQEKQMKQEQSFSMPHGKVTGQAALDKMNNDRKGMGGASG